jgi:hypothetical protein
MARTTVVGLSETLRELQKMDAELVKEIRKDWRRIAKPAIADARFFMPDDVPLSGMRRGRLTYDPKIADRKIGAYLRPKTKRRKSRNIETHSLFNIEERDAGASIFDIAGRKSRGSSQARRKMPNGSIKVVQFDQTFIKNLEKYYGRGQYKEKASRAMWPGVEHSAPRLAAEMEQSVNDRIRKYNREARRV